MRHRSLMCTQQPALQQAGDPVGSRQQVITDDGTFPHDLPVIARLGQPAVTAPIVRQHLGFGFDHFGHCHRQHRLRHIGHAPQPDAADLGAIGLRGDQHQSLARCAPAAFARPFPADVHLVHLHRSGQSVAARAYHCPSQLVQPPPSGRIADAQHPL